MADPGRRAAVRLLSQVMPASGNGASLRQVLATLPADLSPQQRGLATDLAFGVCRHYRLLDHWLGQQLEKPIRAKAWPVKLALLAALYEVWFTERPRHAVLNAWPDVLRAMKSAWAAGLCNALLRKAVASDMAAYAESLEVPERYSLPTWLWRALSEAWPAQSQAIAAALQAPPPMTLRLSPALDRAAWQQQCAEADLGVVPGLLSPHAMTVSPAVPVARVPGFGEGLVSVQDEAAQLPVNHFALAPGDRVLDACAAPGGKTLQLLQQFPGIAVTALDVSPGRLARIGENLARAEVSACLIEGDAAKPEAWFDGEAFDAILVDAPCSATGILRRQPDAKWHRRPEDLAALTGLQARMLDALWPLLKPGGIMMYATCSILPQENSAQVTAFLQRHADAQAGEATQEGGVGEGPGCQLLPGADTHDGFYFCPIRKR